MNAFTDFSRRTQQLLCLLMSVAIVSGSLLAGSYAAGLTDGGQRYSVTITQIQ